MLSTEANDIAEKETKKTIMCEHITTALQDLGFGDYVPELVSVAESFKTSQAVRESFTAVAGVLAKISVRRQGRRNNQRSN